MHVGNTLEYLAMLAELENLKANFTSLEVEDQWLLGDRQNGIVEKQLQQEEFTWRVQKLESTFVALQQQRKY